MSVLPDSLPEALRKVTGVLVNLPHFRELGLTVVDVGRGRCTLRLDYHPRLAGNPETGVLHGGVISTLMDSVCGIVVFVAQDEPRPVATLDLRIDYLRPAEPGRAVFGFAECYHMTRSVAFVRGVAYHDDQGRPIAQCNATFMVGSVGFKVDVGGSDA